MNVTDKTHKLVRQWQHTRDRVIGLKNELNHAECAGVIATNELGKWLVPEGQNDEPFDIWFGSGILQAIRTSHGNYVISWRKEPDGKDLFEFGT